MKRLVSIQDISCFGKCSQTAALPIISAMGIETVILPTAVLSTHTGDFSGYSFLSLSSEMKKISAHWKKLGIFFDAIYIGYIGTTEQISYVCDFIDTFSNENTVVYVDPAMADNGELYKGLTNEYLANAKKLIEKADIISPNIYEAMLLVDGKCTLDYSPDNAKRLAKSLSAYCNKTIITGIHYQDKILSLGYEASNDKYTKIFNDKVSGMFYGTGDVFASSFIGAYLNGLSFDKSIQFADDFVQKCIRATLLEKEKYWYGINYEECLYHLTDFYKEIKNIKKNTSH